MTSIKMFPYGHAMHPQWQSAAGLTLAQLRAHMTLPGYASTPTLGLLYITDRYAGQAQEILDFFQAELPSVTDWVGTVGVGVSSNNVEYFDEPAMVAMLCELPADQYRVFSGVAPLPGPGASAFHAHTALVHADAGSPDITELIRELASRTDTGYLFGGLAASRAQSVQFAVSGNGNIRGQGRAGGVFHGGLSGVAFGNQVSLLSRVTQGCSPVGPVRRISKCERNLVLELDGRPALDVLLSDLKVSAADTRGTLALVRDTLAGLGDASSDSVNRAGQFGADVRVRHVIGLDTANKGVAVADVVEPGMTLAFCQRNAAAARADLIRVCAEIREELEPEEMTQELAAAFAAGEAQWAPHPARRMAGAIYVSCSGRGGPHFGGPSAELQTVRRALGDVPLVGFFAGGEIGRHHLYGYTGVLTVFTDGSQPNAS